MVGRFKKWVLVPKDWGTTTLLERVLVFSELLSPYPQLGATLPLLLPWVLILFREALKLSPAQAKNTWDSKLISSQITRTWPGSEQSLTAPGAGQ